MIIIVDELAVALLWSIGVQHFKQFPSSVKQTQKVYVAGKVNKLIYFFFNLKPEFDFWPIFCQEIFKKCSNTSNKFIRILYETPKYTTYTHTSGS